MVPYVNICGFPFIVSGQIFKKILEKKKKKEPQRPFKLCRWVLSWDIKSRYTETKLLPSYMLLSFSSMLSLSLSFLPIPLILYFSLYPLFAFISPTPISQSIICSSRNRLQWWKRKNLKQSPLARQETAEGGGWWLGQSLRKESAYCSEALNPTSH